MYLQCSFQPFLTFFSFLQSRKSLKKAEGVTIYYLFVKEIFLLLVHFFFKKVLHIQVLYDFLGTVKAATHEGVIRTGQP